MHILGIHNTLSAHLCEQCTYVVILRTLGCSGFQVHAPRDLVEPMTFFTFYSFGLASYLYFLLTRQEFTWERLHDRVFKHQLDKVATDHSFDAQQYEKLAKELRRHKQLLMRAAK